MRALLALACLLLPPRAAAGIEAGGDQTFGPDGYLATQAHLRLESKAGWYLQPSFSYSGSSGSVTRTYSGAAGYEGERFTLGAEGGMTPDVPDATGAKYYSYFYGAEFTVTVLRSEGSSRDEGDAWSLDLGGGALHTRHKQQVPTKYPPNPRPGFEFSAGETDLSATAAFSLLSWTLNGGYTQSLYDREIPSRPRLAERAAAKGGNPAVFGFPEYRLTADLSYSGLPVVTPSCGYEYLDYLVNQPPQKTYRTALSAEAGRYFTVKGGVDLLDPGGGAAKRFYYSAGLTLRF